MKHLQCLGSLLVLVSIGCGSSDETVWNVPKKQAPSTLSPVNLVSKPIEEKKWYQGGTLHKKGVLDWQKATLENKLATCADFVAKMWKDESFVPEIQENLETIEDLKPYAQELVTFIDAASVERENPEDNEKAFTNQTVSEFAVIGMVMMKWLK